MRYILIEQRADDIILTEFSNLQKARDAYWLAKERRDNSKVRLAEVIGA